MYRRLSFVASFPFPTHSVPLPFPLVIQFPFSVFFISTFRSTASLFPISFRLFFYFPHPPSVSSQSSSFLSPPPHPHYVYFSFSEMELLDITLTKTRVFCSKQFTVSSRWILQKTYSAMILKLITKNPRNKKTRIYSWIAFCRSKIYGRKPDKSSSRLF
jgi:hypothetical protein